MDIEREYIRIWVFDNLEEAEQAWQTLLANDFSEAALNLTVREDEAGPVEGNFCVGNGEGETGPARGILKSWIGSNEDSYDQNFHKVKQRGTIQLTVAANTAASQALAGEICQRYGATAAV